MSKTKAGGCGDREVDMHLWTGYAILQLRLTSRSFVSVGMAGIIRSRVHSCIQVQLRSNHHPRLTLRNTHGKSSAVVSVFLEPFLIFLQSEIPALAGGVLSLIGGVIGFARKRSVPSLIGGLSYVTYPLSTVHNFRPICQGWWVVHLERSHSTERSTLWS